MSSVIITRKIHQVILEINKNRNFLIWLLQLGQLWPVLQRFRQVLGRNFYLSGQVSDGAG